MEKTGAQPASASRVAVSDQWMSPQSDPVPLLTSIGITSQIYGWVPSARRLDRIPGVEQDPRGGTVAAGAGHTIMYFLIRRDTTQTAVPLREQERVSGVFRLDVRSGLVERASFEAQPDSRVHLNLAGAPDGQQVAIAEEWPIDDPDPAPFVHRRGCTLWIARFDGTPPRQLISIEDGGPFGGVDDLAVQWTPDGTLVALSFLHAVTENGMLPRQELLLFRAADGRQVAAVDDLNLLGSVSFSPDGSRLLAATFHQELVIHDLVGGQNRPIPLLPGPRTDPNRHGVPRVLGFADHDRLLVVNQRGKSMVLATCGLAGEDPRPVLRWTGNRDMYPFATLMPAGYWP